jgi:hypothetical protein
VGRFDGSDTQGECKSGCKTSTEEVEIKSERMGDISEAL